MSLDTPADAAAAITDAATAVHRLARRTPVLPYPRLSRKFGGEVVLKAENLQSTGSFKLRGVANKLASLGNTATGGVVAGSAGNHAQALASGAQQLGIACHVVMPSWAALAKIEAAKRYGATVELAGDSLESAVARAKEHAETHGMTFVHPYDDPAVIAGQGTVGMEIAQDVDDLSQVVVPLGGGGLLAGVAAALRHAVPDVRIVGVQAAACAPFAEVFHGRSADGIDLRTTIADGISVKKPGEHTIPLVRRYVDDVVTVTEDETAEAMVTLLDQAKLVVEGAGAVGMAALTAGKVQPPPSGTTVVVLSGGNVDTTVLASVARRHETQMGRRLVVLTKISDAPGSLAALLTAVGAEDASLVDVQHVRDGLDLHVRETGVQLVMETRGHEHARAVVEAVEAQGHTILRVDGLRP